MPLSNRSVVLSTLSRTRYLAVKLSGVSNTLSNLRQVSQHVCCLLQASDILTAAAPINLKKQDLLDLESGVSVTLLLSHLPSLSLDIYCVSLCNVTAWEPDMHAQRMPAKSEYQCCM